jgi:hypothetical protein
MKKILSILSITAVMAACTSNQDKIAAENAKLKAYQDSINMVSDTAGLAEYQQWKAQNELGEQQAAAAVPVQRSTATRSTSTTRKSSGTKSTGSSGTMSSTSTTAAKKEGWSKTAKGAVIGGVVGAGAGAVINKKNRAAGAVIGGVVGAGAGAVIGRQQDKKDGRVGN